MEQSPPETPVHNTIWGWRERLRVGKEQVSYFETASFKTILQRGSQKWISEHREQEKQWKSSLKSSI